MNNYLRCFLLTGILLSGRMLQVQAQEKNKLLEHIRQLQQTVQNRHLLIKELKADQAHELPIGLLSNKGEGDKPAILIDSITLYPTYAEFMAYAAIELPGVKEPIYFATVNPVRLSFNGGLLNTARMELVEDKKIRMGADDTYLIVQKAKSYIEFDCYGFKRAGLGVEVQLSSKLVKENTDGSQNTTERVKGKFVVEFSNLNDIVASLNIEPFQVKDVKGLSFTVTDAVVDLSDYQNAAGMVFPKGYAEDYLAGADHGLWRGFYLKTVSVKLPPEIKDRSAGGRKEIGARNLLIDSHGFSGEVYAKNLISLQNGDLGGWSYSVDSVNIGFTANQLTSAALRGGLNIPISGDTTKLAYTALFNPGREYLFNVAAGKKLDFNIFKAANVSLKEGSFIEVALKEGKFEAMANLSGKMSISASISGNSNETNTANKFNLADIKFEQLLISTKAPYIHSGTFDLAVPVKLGSFEVDISKISLVQKDNKRGLGFDMKVSLMQGKDANNSFSADASLMILGQVNTLSNGRQQYQYVSTEFSRIHVNVDQGSFSLDGNLNFFKEEPTFGSGFKGDLTVIIKPGITIAATALFGKVNDLNYWYTDALAEFSPGIPLAAPLEINGFAGGLYYAVKQKPGDGGTLAPVNSQTGLAYLPDATAGLGVKAAVRFRIAGKQSLFNGDVGFEITFNKGGGLSRISLMGNANFMQDPLKEVTVSLKLGSKKFVLIKPGENKSSDDVQKNAAAFGEMNKRGALSAAILVDYDVDNQRFYANFKAYINVAGGTLKGVNAGGLAGEGVICFAPGTWYVHIGTPTAPVGVEILGIAKTTAYFMVGKDLPGSPPPPANVSQILGGKDLDYMRDLNALSSGKGIAFGASLAFNTGDLNFLIFYAHFAAGAGFDVMLKDYGNQAHCEGGSGPIGINGWYANGQVYAYVQGKIGLQCKLFGKKRRFDIIDLAAAAVLQAKLPNPTWMKGIVGGHYRILGGLIKGSCRFEFTVGNECKITGTDAFAESGVQVIAEVTPKKNDKGVDVFTSPQALFNIPVGETFSISDQDGKNLLFRSRLDLFSVKSGGVDISGAMQWNSDHTVLAYNATDVLPSQKEITVSVKISFEENKGGAWTPYLVDGKNYTEQVSNTFTSGIAPEFIPANNVAYSYPITDQLNYYKNESKTGYIKLKHGQGYLFDPNGGFKQVGRILSLSGDVKEFGVSYANNQVDFTLPDIANDMGYEFAIVSVPKVAGQAIDRNVKTEEQSVLASDSSDVVLTTRKSEGNILNAEDKTTYTMNFRSSKYSTFGEKIDQAVGSYSYIWPLRNGVDELGYAFNTSEFFDDFEMNDESSTNLVRLEADLSDNSWYKTYVYPYVYQDYPVSAKVNILWRDPVGKLGVPPVKAMYIINNGNISGLKYSPGQPVQSGKVALVYNLLHYIEKDYYEVQAKVANAHRLGGMINISQTMKNFIELPFTPVKKGAYVFKASYVLPGINKVSSVKQLVINGGN